MEFTESETSKVLIIDDSKINISLISEALEGKYTVLSAKDGQKGLELAYSELPDIILLDIMMPGINGYEVCEQLKLNPFTKDIPVIFITAISEAEFEEKGLSIGAIDYITKPINPSIVKLRVRNHIELKKSRDILRELTTIDGLTGVHNRRFFDETFAKEWMRALRTQKPISLIMIDIDFFKRFNDHYGHQEGDKCLITVAQTLKSMIKRSGDFVARYGGEEFVIVLPETERVFAETCMKNTLSALKELNIPHEASETASYVTISAGISSVIPEKSQNLTELIKSADKALYNAKHNGRNRFEFLSF